MTGASQRIWEKVNLAIQGESSRVVVATLLQGLCALMELAGAAEDDDQARIILAATLLSPGNEKLGSLVDRLPEGLAQLHRVEAEGPGPGTVH